MSAIDRLSDTDLEYLRWHLGNACQVLAHWCVLHDVKDHVLLGSALHELRAAEAILDARGVEARSHG